MVFIVDFSLWFPLIQLPRKSEVKDIRPHTTDMGEKFPLIQLPRKSEVLAGMFWVVTPPTFPLIQLPRKSEASLCLGGVMLTLFRFH